MVMILNELMIRIIIILVDYGSEIIGYVVVIYD